MTSTHEDDGLGSFNLEQLGQKVGAFGGARLLKFTAGAFVTREGEVIGAERELIVLGLSKIVQKFVGQKLVDTIVLPPEEKFPDIKAMNESAPLEEWGTDLNGKPAGPYTRVLVLKLLDGKTIDRFAFVTSSIGGSIAVGDISDKTKVLRRLRGPNIAPVVSCHSTLMKSRFNPRGVPRPDFRILRWIELGDGGGNLPAPGTTKSLPTSSTAAAPPAAHTAAAAPPEASSSPTTASASLGKPVTLPTLSEEMEDSVPF